MPTYPVTLEDFIPGERFDGNPWTGARVEYSATRSGTYVAFQTFTFSDPDGDPANPKARNLTANLSPAPSGWFKVVFTRAGEEQPAAPVYYPDTGIRPTLEQMGALMRTRTKASLAGGGRERGTFDATTSPTGDEVNALIDESVEDLTTHIGAIPESIEDVARRVVKYDVAMQIELAYFTEQVGTGRSPYPQYQDLHDRQLKLLEQAAKEAASGEAPGISDDAYLPVGSFPLTTPQLDPVTGELLVDPASGPVGWNSRF